MFNLQLYFVFLSDFVSFSVLVCSHAWMEKINWSFDLTFWVFGKFIHFSFTLSHRSFLGIVFLTDRKYFLFCLCMDRELFFSELYIFIYLCIIMLTLFSTVVSHSLCLITFLFVALQWVLYNQHHGQRQCELWYIMSGSLKCLEFPYCCCQTLVATSNICAIWK